MIEDFHFVPNEIERKGELSVNTNNIIVLSSSFEGYPLQVRHKQNWGRGFILLLPQTAALPESDAGSDVIKPESSFVIQNCRTVVEHTKRQFKLLLTC